MTLARYTGTVQDAAGNAVAGCEIEVRSESTGLLAVLYSDRDGLNQISNRFTAPDATFSFHTTGGAYRVTATKAGFSAEWRFVAIGTMQEQDVEGIVFSLQAGIVPALTRAELELYIPPVPEEGEALPRAGVVYADPVASNNGYWVYSFADEEWKWARPLSDTLARLTIVGGDENAIVATASPGVDPASVIAFFIDPSTPNTGLVTISINGDDPVSAYDYTGAEFPAGAFSNRLFLTREADGSLQSVMPADIVAQAAAKLEEFLSHFLGNFADDTAAATAAGTPVEGQFYWNTTSKIYRYFDGSTWQPFPYAALDDGSVTEPKLANAVALSLANVQPTRAGIAALDTTRYNVAYLAESGRAGAFLWNPSDLSARLSPSSLTTTSVDDAGDVLTLADHGLRTGDGLYPTTTADGLTAETIYRVIAQETDAVYFYNQTAAFTVGQTLTGGTSGATATIDKIDDRGTWGLLYLSNLTGAYVVDETITDGAGGSADAQKVNATEYDPDRFQEALNATDAFAGTAVNLTGTTNLTFNKHIDPGEGVYIIPDGSAIDGSQGAWVRQHDGPHDIRWWGGKSDSGTTNNAIALHDAQAALPSEGGSIYVPGASGFYQLNNNFYLKSHNWLVGEGVASFLKGNGAGVVVDAVSFPEIRTLWGIDKIRVDRAGAVGPAVFLRGKAVSGHAPVRGVIRDLTIRASTGDGLVSEGSYLVDMYNPNIHDLTNGIGLKLTQDPNASLGAYAWKVYGGEIAWCNIGVFIYRAFGVHFYGTAIEGNLTRGADVNEFSDAVGFYGCYFEANGGSTGQDIRTPPLQVRAPRSLVIDGCNFQDSGGKDHSIVLNAGENVSVTNNWFNGYPVSKVMVGSGVTGYERNNRVDASSPTVDTYRTGFRAPLDEHVVTAEVVFDWPSIAAGGASSSTFTVSGVSAGDIVIGWSTTSTGIVGLQMTAAVVGTNTVRVNIHNPSGSAVDMSSATFRFIVLKQDEWL
ncbi:MAG: hypothetical protein CML24_11420 [Rhizobiales bacterium]|nr:hypothetical protein [Hyphomicrobiales bacterium]